eukprot:1107945-Prymnesium_polylepis.1
MLCNRCRNATLPAPRNEMARLPFLSALADGLAMRAACPSKAHQATLERIHNMPDPKNTMLSSQCQTSPRMFRVQDVSIPALLTNDRQQSRCTSGRFQSLRKAWAACRVNHHCSGVVRDRGFVCDRRRSSVRYSFEIRTGAPIESKPARRAGEFCPHNGPEAWLWPAWCPRGARHNSTATEAETLAAADVDDDRWCGPRHCRRRCQNLPHESWAVPRDDHTAGAGAVGAAECAVA